MSQLKEYDDTENNEDEYETPTRVFDDLCKKYGITPLLDVAATKENKKCKFYCDKLNSGLHNKWPMDVWLNPPHTLTEEFNTA